MCLDDFQLKGRVISTGHSVLTGTLTRRLASIHAQEAGSAYSSFS